MYHGLKNWDEKLSEDGRGKIIDPFAKALFGKQVLGRGGNLGYTALLNNPEVE